MADIPTGESAVGTDETALVDDEMCVGSTWGIVAWEEGVNLDNTVVVGLLEATQEGAINVGWISIVVVITRCAAVDALTELYISKRSIQVRDEDD